MGILTFLFIFLIDSVIIMDEEDKNKQDLWNSKSNNFNNTMEVTTC